MTIDTDLYEKLGAFYLGGQSGPDGERAPLLYDSRDLLTHAVCVGMTGSGKTGLCVGLLEEAAIDGVPAIVVDPKGDLANLLLTFPDLAPHDFAPWVSEDDARRKGMELDAFAEREATKWREGLASWGQGPDRIRRLREAADFAIYTPGASSGLPLSILKSFSAPTEAVRDDADLFAERIATTVSSLLGLLGIDADPVQSREHILLSNILATAWREGRAVDLPALIAAVQTPPFDTIGVLDLEQFYPGKDRFKLSMAINNLIASPGFASWMEGEPLDIDRLLYGENGQPRITILSIAHLSDQERMFFVALLFNEVLGWTRAQSGSRNLRALLYMDEIYGYVPPVANPPSKKPLLTLMKQARAFGLGVVLATQNPVDLDYKALSNAGTWFIGRLQTAQDKARLLEALDGASANAGEQFDKDEADRLISGLGSRRFLLHNVHDPHPVVFETRWVMSYLRGPLVRDEIKRLMDPLREAAAAAATAAQPAQVEPPAEAPAATASAPAAAQASASAPPTVPRGVAVGHVPVTPSLRGAAVTYRPALLGTADLSLEHRKSGFASTERIRRVVSFLPVGGAKPWAEAIPVGLDTDRLEPEPAPNAAYLDLPAEATDSVNYTAWRDALADHLYDHERGSVLYCEALDAWSQPGEDERALRMRLAAQARERLETERQEIRERFATRVRRAEERVTAAEARVEREKGQARRAKVDAGMKFGGAVLDAFFGRSRSASRAAASGLRKGGRAREQAADVGVAEEALENREADLHDVQQALQAELAELDRRLDPAALVITREEITPRRKDIAAPQVTLVWMPLYQKPDGAFALACDVSGKA